MQDHEYVPEPARNCHEEIVMRHLMFGIRLLEVPLLGDMAKPNPSVEFFSRTSCSAFFSIYGYTLPFYISHMFRGDYRKKWHHVASSPSSLIYTFARNIMFVS